MKRSDRQHLNSVLQDLHRWADLATQSRWMSLHQPIRGFVPLAPTELALVDYVAGAVRGDSGEAARASRTRLFGGRASLQPARDAAHRLQLVHDDITTHGRDRALVEIHMSLVARAESERAQLQKVIAELSDLQQRARGAVQDLSHLPLTRTGLLTDLQVESIGSLAHVIELHSGPASKVLDSGYCWSGSQCRNAHSSATLLVQTHADVAHGLASEIRTEAERIANRLRSEKEVLSRLSTQLGTWPQQIDRIRKRRREAPREVKQHLDKLKQAGVPVAVSGLRWNLLPVGSEDQSVVADLKILRDSPLTPAVTSILENAGTSSARFQKMVRSTYTPTWTCAGTSLCLPAHELSAAIAPGVAGTQSDLDRLGASPAVSSADLDHILEPSLRLLDFVKFAGLTPVGEIIDAALMARARGGLTAVAQAGREEKESAAAAKAAGDTVRADDVRRALVSMDLDVLRKASPDTIRISPLNEAGLSSVWEVLKYSEKYDLEALPGLGEVSARSITQAALRLFTGVRDETPVRIDVKSRNKKTTTLLDALRRWDVARQFKATEDEVALATALMKLSQSRRKSPLTQVLAITDATPAQGIATLSETLSSALSRTSPPNQQVEVWTDFLTRPSDYFGMLTELGFVTEDEANMHGDLPAEIIEAVRAKELKRDALTASLRTYQSFAARFALVQEKVVIGDEMGLGKTVEALAAIAHLHASGETHFLVVCPAAVVSNWIREAGKHTTIRSFRLHGGAWERGNAAKAWVRSGGIAVTTYDVLGWAEDYCNRVDLSAAVFDEAHYIKNPLAKRSQASQRVIDEVKYAILMTGTPLENRVQEFRNLIGYVRPDLADSAPEYLPSKFRKHVAPAYLRRNQEDVLTELPELVEIDEWMGMSDADERAYRAAVSEGHFMSMRRAAMLSEQSLKVERLLEIVGEAEANGRRVIVFSYFRDVLSELARGLPGQVFGPLTGSVPAAERQRLVDKFSSAGEGAVLVSQITAGGVGLNIQSASVVVICEPQLKPTTEAQAVARAHRMGQANTVQVHRLLTENSVDERIREILSEKRDLFDQFARDSAIAQQAPDAVDVSDAELARIVIAAERERLFGQSEQPDG